MRKDKERPTGEMVRARKVIEIQGKLSGMTEIGARVTFSRVRVTRIPPASTMGTDEGDVRG